MRFHNNEMTEDNKAWHADGVRFLNTFPSRFLNKDPPRQDPNGNLIGAAGVSSLQRIRGGDDNSRKSQSLPRVPTAEAKDNKHRNSGSAPDKELNIVVLGGGGVGKTALIVRFLTRRFIGDYAQDESRCSCTTYLDGKPLRLTIQDTKQISGELLCADHVRWGEAFVVVFSVTSGPSFQAVEAIFHRILKEKRPVKERPPIVVIANKIDLCHHRQVSETDIDKLSVKLRCPVVKTSASEDYSSVVEAFTCLFDQALRGSKTTKGFKKNGTSKIAQIRETLRSLADFRNRTNTF